MFWKKKIIENVKDTGIPKLGSGYIILFFFSGSTSRTRILLYLISLVSPESCETPLELLSHLTNNSQVHP